MMELMKAMVPKTLGIVANPFKDQAKEMAASLRDAFLDKGLDVVVAKETADLCGMLGEDVLLRNPDAATLSGLTRHVFSSSSCGICGKATIEAIILLS